MVRITGRFARAKAQDEMRRFLRGRTLAYIPNNVCLSTDYALRWLNAFPKDAEALSLGQLLGDAAGQPELSDKCFEALSDLCAAKARSEGRFGLSRTAAASAARTAAGDDDGGMGLTEAQQGEMLSEMIAPEVAELLVTLQTLLSEAGEARESGGQSASSPSSSSDERNPLASPTEDLIVSPTAPLVSIQQLLDKASASGRAIVDVANDDLSAEGGAVSSAAAASLVPHRRVEILSPTDAPYGRGLFAAAPLRQGEVLFAETPALHVTMPPNPMAASSSSVAVCSFCARSLAAANGPSASTSSTPCRSECAEARYCSPQCEANGYAVCHGPVCTRTNPMFANWAAPMLADYYGASASAGAAPTPRDKKAALTMYAVGMLCATATAAQVHPLRYAPIAMLSGRTAYARETALAHTGAIAVGLAASLRQEHLYLDDVLSLFALLMDNGFYNEGRAGGVVGGAATNGPSFVATTPTTLSLYPLLSMVNHSCVPNAAITDAPTSGEHRLVKQLTVLRDVLPGEQLFINYNHKLMGQGRSMLGYEARKELLAQRHFTCTCPKCVLRQ